jgi:hypothetical protein
MLVYNVCMYVCGLSKKPWYLENVLTNKTSEIRFLPSLHPLRNDK